MYKALVENYLKEIEAGIVVGALDSMSEETCQRSNFINLPLMEFSLNALDLIQSLDLPDTAVTPMLRRLFEVETAEGMTRLSLPEEVRYSTIVTDEGRELDEAIRRMVQ